MPVEFNLESVDGKTRAKVSGFTTDRVTGDLRPIDWQEQFYKWPHLERLQFANIGPRPMIDILIGVDQAELHYSLQDACGKPGEPIARLTPLGWTCVGGPKMSNGHAANFNAAFFVSSADRELNITLQKF